MKILFVSHGQRSTNAIRPSGWAIFSGSSERGPSRNSLCFLRNGAVWLVALHWTIRIGAGERPSAAATGPMIVRGRSETLIVTANAMRTTAVDARQTRMTALDIVLADIATLEAARDALPSHSHIAALLSLTLYRLQDEADALHREALKRAA